LNAFKSGGDMNLTFGEDGHAERSKEDHGLDNVISAMLMNKFV